MSSSGKSILCGRCCWPPRFSAAADRAAPPPRPSISARTGRPRPSMAGSTRRSRPGFTNATGSTCSLRPGGPQVNHAQLLAAGVLDFNIASNSFVPLNYVQQNIPMVAVAAIFQKDPSVLIAHPGQGDDSLAALKGKPIMIGSDTRVTVLAVPEAEIRLYRRPDPALCVQRRAVPRRPEGDPAGLSDQRAVHDHRKQG